MRFRDAKKLHNADEVRDKKTKQVCRVIQAHVGKKDVTLAVIHPQEGYMEINHRLVS